MRRAIRMLLVLCMGGVGLVLTGCDLLSPARPDWSDEYSGFYPHYVSAPDLPRLAPSKHVRLVTVNTQTAFLGTLQAATRDMRVVGGTHVTSVEGGNWKGTVKLLGRQQGANLAIVLRQSEGSTIGDSSNSNTYSISSPTPGLVTVSKLGGGVGEIFSAQVSFFHGDKEAVASLDPIAATIAPDNPALTIWGLALDLDFVDALTPRHTSPRYSTKTGVDTTRQTVSEEREQNRNRSMLIAAPSGYGAYGDMEPAATTATMATISLFPPLPPGTPHTLRQLGRILGADRVVLQTSYLGDKPFNYVAAFYRKPILYMRPH